MNCFWSPSDWPLHKDRWKLNCSCFSKDWQYDIPRHMVRKYKHEPILQSINLKAGQRNREDNYSMNIVRVTPKTYNFTVIKMGKIKNLVKYNQLQILYGFRLYAMSGKESFSEISIKLQIVSTLFNEIQRN